jgi:polysaccharide pyruvyl transferase WcaK-like protein
MSRNSQGKSLSEIKMNLQEWLKVEAFNDMRSIQSALSGKSINGYFGWVGYGNLGDEAVFKAYVSMLSTLQLKPIRISKPTYWLNNITNLEPNLKSVGLGGGTIINQSDIWLEETKYVLSREIPMYCIGTGVAPPFSVDKPLRSSNTAIYEWAKHLSKFVYVGVRGPDSQTTLKNVGFNAEVVGDSAISLAKKQYVKKNYNKVIGVNISYGAYNIMHGDQDELIKEVSTALQHLLDDGFTIKILPIWKEDLAASIRLSKLLKSPNCTLIKAYSSIDKYMAEIEKCDLFLGQKLHATVFATLLRIPSVMLDYRPKCLDYMRSLGMDRYSIRTDKVKADLIISKLNELQEDRKNVIKTLDARILHYKYLQEKRASEIIKILS